MSAEAVNVAQEISSGDATLADLRRELHHLIAGVGRPIHRVSLRSGASVIEVEWEPSGGGGEPAEHALAGTATPDQPRDQRIPDAEPAANQHRIVAPLVGTYYSAPAPGAEPFVSVGDLVQPGKQVAIVEAMKLMNAVTADCAGRVVAIEVNDGEMVEFGQTLIVIEPGDGAE